MAMHGDYSPEARDRAKRTVTAAGVFGRNADAIVAAADVVAEGYVLVAVVSAAHELAGTHHVDQAEIVERVPALEGDGGWAMVFSPGTTVADVRRRTTEMADTAARRALLIERLIAKRT